MTTTKNTQPTKFVAQPHYNASGSLIGWTGFAYNRRGKSVKVFVPAKVAP